MVMGKSASAAPLPPNTRHAAGPARARKEYIASRRPKPAAAFSKNSSCCPGYRAVDCSPYTSHDPVVASGSFKSKYTDSSPYLARGVVEALCLRGGMVGGEAG